MKQKHFMFALVVMLSLAFSAFAQTVNSGADLKNTLNKTGADIMSDNDITSTSGVISIPGGVTVTLDFNGKKIEGTHSGYMFDVAGSLTVKDSQGTGYVTG